ncbi:MAG: hypothetical protein A2Z72_01710 [Omnitrophica bacterium RBG_13_46_9]|nr:MAG: hypothetical protein A2Z72_01710 [Omnitrophica bacterium RBG_13_46_9]
MRKYLRIFFALSKRAVTSLFPRLAVNRNIDNYGIYISRLKNKNGLEIGGPSNIFRENDILPVYPFIANLDDYSFNRPVEHRGRLLREGFTYEYSKYKKKGYQYIGDAVDLAQIADNTYDFVMGSHISEHIANLFKAFGEWLRVLKDGGAILLVIPHKDGTFDHRRPVTPIGHLIEDYRNDTKEDNLSHLEEVLSLTDIDRDPFVPDIDFLITRSKNNSSIRAMHHHVFDTSLVVSIFDYFKLQILALDQVMPHHIIILGEKVSGKRSVDNSLFTGRNAAYRNTSPFPSDRLKHGA